jgi:lipopolysaccharide assembly outer membrane protein LptD (OstA)
MPGAVLGSVASILSAQGLPPFPRPPQQPPAVLVDELLLLRPVDASESRPQGLPFRWSGERVREGEDLWELEKGLVQSDSVLLLADRIQYRPSTGELLAEGDIRLEAADLRLRCARLKMAWKTQIGEAQALELELPPSWILRSDRVGFASFRHWVFDSVEISPCPQEDPDWKARLSQLKLDLNGFASFRNARVIVGGVPVLYLPWAIYPAKAERSSGLLPPTIGYSTNLGATLGLPYYQVLGASVDATVQPQWFSRQGTMWSSEVRWNPEPTHQGSLAGQFIAQRDPAARRYRGAFKEVWQREDGWQFAADVNQASDNLLENDFGRGVAGPTAANPFDSAIYLGRSFRYLSLALSSAEQRSFSYPNDPLFPQLEPVSLKRRVAPQLDLRMFPIPVAGLYLDADFRANRFGYKVQAGETQPEQAYGWQRFDFATRLHGRLGQWGPFRTDFQAGGRATQYTGTLTTPVFQAGTDFTSTYLQPLQVEGPAATRFLGSARLQFSGPQVGRTFADLEAFGWSGDIKHVLEPFWALTKVSRYGKDAMLPRFDDVDSRPGVGGSTTGEESFELGIKQHLMGRPGAGVPFADLVRWNLSARYHATPILLPDGRSKKGWESLNSDIDIEPNDRLRLSFKRSSDLAQNGSDTSLSVDYRARDGSGLSLAAFSSAINQLMVRQRGIQLGGLQRIWDDRFRLEFQGSYNFDLKSFSSAQVAVAYATPCIAWVLRYSHMDLSQLGAKGKENRFDVILTLRGIGELFTFRP